MDEDPKTSSDIEVAKDARTQAKSQKVEVDKPAVLPDELTALVAMFTPLVHKWSEQFSEAMKAQAKAEEFTVQEETRRYEIKTNVNEPPEVRKEEHAGLPT